MTTFVIHDYNGMIYVDDGEFPQTPFAFTDRPVSIRRKGSDGWLRYITTQPSRYDRVYPPASTFILDYDVKVILTPLTFVFDTETTELFGEIVAEGGAGGVLGGGWWAYGSGDGFIYETLLEYPDLMVGYNLFNYDLKVLLERYPDLVDALKGYIKRTPFRYGGDTKDVDVFYSLVEAIDLYLAVLRWDVENGGKLPSHSLKVVAPMLTGVQMSFADWFEGREHLSEYLFEDILSTTLLAVKLLPPLLAQLVYIPIRPTDVGILGTGQKVDVLMMASYYLMGYGVPKPQKRNTEIQGALVDAKAGVYIGRVRKYDYSSLYPSIVVNEWLVPKNDVLGLFPKWVKVLRDLRLEAKAKKSDPYYQNLQSALKVLINSAYGYCGATFPFADPAVASAITAKGREMVSKLRNLLEPYGEVLNIDTDGVLVLMSDDADGEPDLSVLHPYQVEVEDYDGALVIKKKNYILKKGDKYIVHGNSLRNRTDEPFLADFIQRLMTALFVSPITEDDLKAMIRDAFTSLTPQTACRQMKVGKFTRQHRTELIEGLEEGEKFKAVKVVDGWRRLDDGDDIAPDLLDRLHYFDRLVRAVGRFGGRFEDFSNRYRGKRGLRQLAEELGLDLGEPTKRKSPKSGNLFTASAV